MKKNDLDTRIALIVAAIFVLPRAAADNAGAAQERGWKCERCPQYAGASGEVKAGIGYLPEDSFKFGQYTGLNKEGPYAIIDGEARYRGEGAQDWKLKARNLGLDSRELKVEGGSQGKYRALLGFEQLPKLDLDTARTPFNGVGGTQLTLPGDWDRAPTTGEMTTLPGSLKDVSIRQERKRYDVGFAFIPFRDWEVAGKFRREEKEGKKTIGGAFGSSFASARAAILPEPVDYETDQLDLTASYTGRRFQAQLGYYGSFFDDKKESLRWENPFSTPGVDEGQLALPPDNRFQQFYASLGYTLWEHTRLSAYLATGEMEQDEDFLPFTINAALLPEGVPLPRNDLDGQVDTTTASFKVSSRPIDKLNLNAEYIYNDRDNGTDQAGYGYVIADTAPSLESRINLPYSFTQNQVKLNAGYRLPKRTQVSAGFDYDRFERSYQEVDETEENTFWGKLKFGPYRMVDAWLKYAYSDRDGSDYKQLSQILSPGEAPLDAQNPLMRIFYMADRERDQIGGSITVTPIQRVSLGLHADYGKDDYTNSSVGLTEADDLAYTLDVSYSPTERITTYAFYTRDKITSEQVGSQLFFSPEFPTQADWRADIEDKTDTVGVGLKVTAIRNKLDIGADYVYAESTGEIDVQGDSFPDLNTRLNRFNLYAIYKLKQDLSVRLGYLYEDYDSSDWAIDGVQPNTIPAVLSLGELSPYYTVNVYSASLIYRFY